MLIQEQKKKKEVIMDVAEFKAEIHFDTSCTVKAILFRGF